MELRLSVVSFIIINILSVNMQILSNVLNNLASTIIEKNEHNSTLSLQLSQTVNKDQDPILSKNRQSKQYYDSSNGCDQYFSYRNDISQSTFGLISIPNPDRQQNNVMAILTVSRRISSDDYGDISLLNSKEDSYQAVVNGLPLETKVRFPVQNPLPRIHQVYLNDQLLCSVPKESASFVTTLTLSFTFTTNAPPLTQAYQTYRPTNQVTSNHLQNYESSDGCSKHFSYRSDYTGTFGLLTIQQPDRQQNDVKAIMTLATRLPSEDYGDMSLFNSKEETLNAVDNGSPLLMRVRFPLQKPLPKIHQIYFNDRLICSAPKEFANYVTTLTFLSSFITNLPAQPNRPYVHPATQAPYYPTKTQRTTQGYTHYETSQITRRTTFRTNPTRPTTTTTHAPVPEIHSSSNFENDLNDECGVSTVKKNLFSGFIVGGNSAIRGQFPWLVAYFYSAKKTSSFICGGSLISYRVVVTAAHCVHNKHEIEKKKATDSTFFIGKHNLDSLVSENHFQTSVASEIHVHPEWNHNDQRFLGDIAIVVLAKTIEFNKFVKPICIWRETSSSDDIYDKEGIVAGWGKTEFDAISTSEPLYVKIPAVSGLKCALSDTGLSQIVSENSFCAGARQSKKGPCNGDSGGAFAVEDNGKTYLRGIVSAGVIDSATQICDNKKYAVFTDASKYTGWIDEYVRSYG